MISFVDAEVSFLAHQPVEQISLAQCTQDVVCQSKESRLRFGQTIEIHYEGVGKYSYISSQKSHQAGSFQHL
jgi:hypothetical protein